MFKNPRVSAFYESGEFQHINGNSIFWFSVPCQKENAPTVLLLHGFPTSSYDWIEVAPALTKHVNLIGFDFLGFGFSDKPNPHHYSIIEQTEITESFAAQIGNGPLHVLCHDYAVSVGQELIARNVQSKLSFELASCSFLNGGLFPETHQALLIQRLLLSPVGPILSMLMGFAQFKKSFTSVFGPHSQPSESELDEFWEIIHFKNGKHVFHNLITYMKDRITHRSRWVHALKNSTVPLSLINGSLDPVSGAHLVARYKELECRLDHLAELGDIGHYPHVEAPQRIADHYLEFLQSIT